MPSFVLGLVTVKKMKQTGLCPQVTHGLVQEISMVINILKKESKKAGVEGKISLEWPRVGREVKTLSLPLSWPKDLANSSTELSVEPLSLLARINSCTGNNKNRHFSGVYRCQAL